jgi:hypothetical protein
MMDQRSYHRYYDAFSLVFVEGVEALNITSDMS